MRETPELPYLGAAGEQLRGMKREQSSGQSTALVIAAAFVVVLVGVGIFFLIQILGGSREVQNAVDAGVLQAAKTALSGPSVQLTSTPKTVGSATSDQITEFAGLAIQCQKAFDQYFQIDPATDPVLAQELSGGPFYFNLWSINAVWGQALLEALNVQQMEKAGLATAAARDHAQLVQALAQDISAALTRNILADSDPAAEIDKGPVNPLHTQFNQLANRNTVRMLDPKEAVAGNQFQTSFVNRPGEVSPPQCDSNIQFDTAQVNAGPLGLGSVLAGLGPVLDGAFPLGYVPINVKLSTGSLPFMFVPLSHSRKPHLISEIQFNSDTATGFLPGSLAGSVPPNAFQFAGSAQAAKAQKNLNLIAHAVTADMTNGLSLQIPRAFIRVENLPGKPNPSGGPPLHVIDLANRQVISEYNRALANGLGGEAGLVLGRSLFNPVENIWGNSNYESDGVTAMAAICTAACFGGAPFVDACCEAALSAGVTGPALCASCCGTTFVIGALSSATTPCYVGKAPNLTLGYSAQPEYGYLPAVSLPGSGMIFHGGAGCSGTTTERVTPANEGFHKIFYDWLAGDYSADLGPTWVPAFETCDIAGLNRVLANHGDPGSEPTPRLNLTADQLTPVPVTGGGTISAGSGMRDRTPRDATTVSLLNGGAPAAFTRDGTLNSLVFSRAFPPAPLGPDPSAQTIYSLLFQRLAQIYPVSSTVSPAQQESEIVSVLSDNTKPIPMGAQAFIFLNDSGHLQLAVPADGDTLPAWLTAAIQNQAPDGTDFLLPSGNLPTFPTNHPDLQHAYRLIDPNADWAGAISPTIAKFYPTRLGNFDVYHFIPCSGFHGLLGVLRLESRLERKCAKLNKIDSGSSTWSQPQDCFCFGEVPSQINNPNCGHGVFPGL